jgi:hypothetical protein
MRYVLNPQNCSTSELVDLLASNQGKEIEARLILLGCFSTHVLELKGKWLYDMGNDSQLVKTTTSEFLQRYPNNEWTIDLIA